MQAGRACRRHVHKPLSRVWWHLCATHCGLLQRALLYLWPCSLCMIMSTMLQRLQQRKAWPALRASPQMAWEALKGVAAAPWLAHHTHLLERTPLHRRTTLPWAQVRAFAIPKYILRRP